MGQKYFYTFNQNNSGGRLIVNDDISGTVIIQAESEEEAEKRFNKILDKDKSYRIYCPCCGKRWDKHWDVMYDTLEVLEDKREEFANREKSIAIVYYANGEKKKIDWLRYDMFSYLVALDD